MFREIRQRTIEMGRFAATRADQLFERRQDDRSAGAFECFGEGLIEFRSRWGAEIDIERDIGGSGTCQFFDQVSMETARPGPNADRFDRGRVNRYDDDGAAGLARKQAESQVDQRVS
jgi:hypothetical protein